MLASVGGASGEVLRELAEGAGRLCFGVVVVMVVGA